MRYLLLFVATLFTTLVVAQTTIGLRAGFGQSSLRSGATFAAVTEQTQSINSPSLGVVVDVPLSEQLSVRTGLEYARRGTSVGLTQGVELFGVQLPLGARAQTQFSYVDVPLLLQYTLPTSGKLEPYLMGGPTVGYAVSGRLKTSARALVDITLSRTDIDLDAINYERLHVALTAGAGTQVKIGYGTVAFVEARYAYGLTQPYNVPLVRDGVGFAGWNVGAGVRFAL